ncbi:hypothetical protein ABZ929_29510 [Streptomyces physcomitrii]|uniref:hypothetical protein n=1 Tax=Streptomyces physcomitrii TaxID=2724184 RepID=UPI00343E986B
MKTKIGAFLAGASAVAVTGLLTAPGAIAHEGPEQSPAARYTCTSSHKGNTGSAKCVDLSLYDRYRAKVTCTDSRGVLTVFYGPWRGGRSGEWSSYTCPGSGFFYKAGYEVELG